MSIDFKSKEAMEKVSKGVLAKDTERVASVLEKELEKSMDHAEKMEDKRSRRDIVMEKVKDTNPTIKAFYSRFCDLTIGCEDDDKESFSVQMESIINKFQEIADGTLEEGDMEDAGEAHRKHAKALNDARADCRIIRDKLIELKADIDDSEPCVDRDNIAILVKSTIRTYNDMTGLGRYENFHKAVMFVLDGVEDGSIKPKYYLKKAANRYIRSMGSMYQLDEHLIIDMIARCFGEALGLKDTDKISDEVDNGFMIGIMTCINNLKIGRDNTTGEVTFTYNKYANVKGRSNKDMVKRIVSMYLTHPLQKSYRDEFIIRIRDMSAKGIFVDPTDR